MSKKFWLVVITSILLFSCTDTSNNPLSQAGADGKGSIAFSLAKNTIPSEVGILEVRLERDGYDPITTTAVINNFIDTVRILMNEIPAGIWQLTIDAKDSSGFLRYTGSAEVTILENQTVLAIVHMSRVGTGTGSIQINVVWQKSPRLNEEFLLAYGQSVTIQDINLRIKFKEVPEDSRCPLNAECVWAGNARVVLEVNGTLLELNTYLEPKTVLYSGYIIALTRLLPYPDVETMPIQPEEYVAHLYVNPVDEIVMLDWVDSLLIGKVPAVIHDSVTVSQGILRMNVSYGGGCSVHNFALYGLSHFLKSNPPQAEIFLSHNGSDPCDAWITTEVQFNLSPLITECKKQFGSGQILLRIYPPGGNEPVKPLVPVSF